MRKLENGWCVPEGDIKMTTHVETDTSVENPGYEQRHRDTILSHIPIKETFVDVGANLGIWSIAMSKHFKKVIAFEPSPRNRECLEQNVSGRADIRPYAVGNENGVVQFYDAIKNCGDCKVVTPSIGSKKNQYEVGLVKLDDQEITNCSLIKIDVQGYELPVILGAEKIITEQQPWIIFEINEDIDLICEFLEKRNYDMILNKSKRVVIFAPKSGPLSPKSKDAFGRWFGDGPYTKLIKQKPAVKQPWHD